MNAAADSPALVAARAADRQMLERLTNGGSFLLEAGAGAGKTFSLVEALKHLIQTRGKEYRRFGKRVACITFTNAATSVINGRIDGNALVFIDTIHAFCWSMLSRFQSAIREEIRVMPVWQERANDTVQIDRQRVEYDLGYRAITEIVISIHHDDVLALMTKLLKFSKFRWMVAQRYPVILIDEYQDTNAQMMEALKLAFLDEEEGPILGLFGDHWQRIYDKTCGHVSHSKVAQIGKGANFRSSSSVVEVLNRMRPELTQSVKDVSFIGSAEAYHTNLWQGMRRPSAGGGHWTGDLPEEVAHATLLKLIRHLKERGWDFSAQRTKILMLTHNVLAKEQGYSGLLGVFPYSDALMKKEDDFIAFFAERLEPACGAFQRKRFGEVFSSLGLAAPRISCLDDKERWSRAMTALIELRRTGTIGDVLDQIQRAAFPQLPEMVSRRNREAVETVASGEVEVPESVERVMKLRGVPYAEVMAVIKFIDGHTPFATKHSVKGDEFENVLVVVGRGWNKYNFGQYLELARSPTTVAEGRRDAYDRNRNLLYVACSRSKERLALLITQELSAQALQTLSDWFGVGAVHSFAPE